MRYRVAATSKNRWVKRFFGLGTQEHFSFLLIKKNEKGFPVSHPSDRFTPRVLLAAPENEL
jgi:hypothetical protein